MPPTDPATDDVADATHYRRPAEAQLPRTIRTLRTQLLAGFHSRDAVLQWLQELAVRTLGEVPTRQYVRFAAEFRPDSEHTEGVLLAAFLDSETRTRDLEPSVADCVRRQWAAEVIAPVQADSFRSLRKDAGEYVGETERDGDGDAGHDPAKQSIAMRPALEELHAFQEVALHRPLNGGLDDRREILDWGDDLVVATRGEPLGDGTPPGAFIRDLHNDPCGDLLLCDDRPHWRRCRQWYLCRNVLPAFNRGVRDLARRTAEEPTTSDGDALGETPEWG
ncbi:hypothetical protein [Halobellus ruber]|uniref:Uncharacterized protein n=1 Tax=Halobellus ruber TaxID=2761102 RepID=A0A7J9SDT6_9EURY|nr:hypothetical protein [Halobellus ruber]MBB6645070.1 hypothetical protein [Halobellus ruber]